MRRHHRDRPRPWPVLALVAGLVVLSVAPGAAYADEVGPATMPGISVYDDPGCQGASTGAVSETFSVRVIGLMGGPLVGVTVRSDSLVVASAVSALDAQGAGCADLPSIEAGSYAVSASAGDTEAATTVVVDTPAVEPPATSEPQPEPTTVAPEPVETPAPEPTETAPPVEPTPDPTPAPVDPAPQPTSQVPSPAPTAVASAIPGTVPVPAAAGDRSSREVAPARSEPRVVAPVSPAPPATPEATPTSPASTPWSADSDAASDDAVVVAAGAAPGPPAIVRLAGFVVAELLGVTLLVAFVVLVISRLPRRHG